MGSLSDPRDPAGRLIGAGQVNGTAVYDPNGAKLGTIDDVMIDKISGRIAYAVMSFGGFLGIGDKRHPVPWTALHYDESLGGFIVNINRQQLEGAPNFNTGEVPTWSDEVWGRRVHEYYQAPPFWDMPTTA